MIYTDAELVARLDRIKHGAGEEFLIVLDGIDSDEVETTKQTMEKFLRQYPGFRNATVASYTAFAHEDPGKPIDGSYYVWSIER